MVAERPTLFLLGDSHAWAYSDVAARLNRDGLANVSRHIVLGCSGATLRKPVTPRCGAQFDSAVREIVAQARPGDIVLLGALRTPRLGDQWITFDQNKILADQFTQTAQQDRDAAFKQAKQLIEKLRAAGLTVIMDAPKPVFAAPAFRCSDWFNRSNPICAPGLVVQREYLTKLREPVMHSLSAMKAEFPDLIVWDNFDVLCSGNPCSAMQGSKPLFFDGDHISGHASQLLYPHFKALLLTHKLIAAK